MIDRGNPSTVPVRRGSKLGQAGQMASYFGFRRRHASFRKKRYAERIASRRARVSDPDHADERPASIGFHRIGRGHAPAASGCRADGDHRGRFQTAHTVHKMQSPAGARGTGGRVPPGARLCLEPSPPVSPMPVLRSDLLAGQPSPPGQRSDPGNSLSGGLIRPWTPPRPSRWNNVSANAGTS